MTDPVEEGNICPCCGTEFGYDDDLGVTYRQLRDLWVQNGAPWFSPVVTPKPDWNPLRQLALADLDFTAITDGQPISHVRVPGTRVDITLRAVA